MKGNQLILCKTKNLEFCRSKGVINGTIWKSPKLALDSMAFYRIRPDWHSIGVPSNNGVGVFLSNVAIRQVGTNNKIMGLLNCGPVSDQLSVSKGSISTHMFVIFDKKLVDCQPERKDLGDTKITLSKPLGFWNNGYLPQAPVME